MLFIVAELFCDSPGHVGPKHCSERRDVQDDAGVTRHPEQSRGRTEKELLKKEQLELFQDGRAG